MEVSDIVGAVNGVMRGLRWLRSRQLNFLAGVSQSTRRSRWGKSSRMNELQDILEGFEDRNRVATIEPVVGTKSA